MEPVDGAKKEELQEQLSELRGLDPSEFKAASAAQAEQAHQREASMASMAARRNAVEATLVAGPPKRPRSLAEPLALAAEREELGQDRPDRAETGLDGRAEASDEHGVLTRPRPAGARRPPSRKPTGAAGGGAGSPMMC